MTDKEIIKGLEKELYHADYHDLDYEDNVPVSLLKNAYTLIIRQQAEIEELNTEIDKQYEQAVADIKGNLARCKMDKLNGAYIRGYTKAIQDIIEVFEYMNDDLTHNNMRMNYKWVQKILKCCLENREKLREDRNGYVRTEKSESGKRDIVKWYSPVGDR